MRRTKGWSMKPVSPMKTMLLRARRAFLYTGPVLFAPALDRLFVAFAGPALGLLAAPAHPPQHAPDMAGMIANAEMLLDQLGHAGQGPKVRAAAVCQWSFQEQPGELFSLLWGQLRLGSGVAFGSQSLVSGSSVGIPPSVDRAWPNPDPAGDL